MLRFYVRLFILSMHADDFLSQPQHYSIHSSDYHYILCSRIKTSQSSIATYRANIWNTLDENLKSSETLRNVKYRYKKHLQKCR